MAGKTDHKLKAEKRTVTGRKVKLLRRAGTLPANIYGKKIKSETIQVKSLDFKKLYKEVGETGLISLELGNETRPVLVHNVHLDPVMDEYLHVDFLQVDLHEKVTATVPIEFEGESSVEKSGEGIIVPQMREIEVEALPMDLPEKIIVDISILASVGDTVKVADLKVDRTKVELKEEDPERIVVSVDEPAKEEVVEEVVAPVEGEAGAAPAEGEAPSAGEQPAEGGEKPAEGGEVKEEKKKE
ncbi:MAG: 50S ribosomal protein L25 [bacterium]|nr:50S ribosomal protein L25 [bacterium]